MLIVVVDHGATVVDPRDLGRRVALRVAREARDVALVHRDGALPRALDRRRNLPKQTPLNTEVQQTRPLRFYVRWLTSAQGEVCMLNVLCKQCLSSDWLSTEHTSTEAKYRVCHMHLPLLHVSFVCFAFSTENTPGASQ